jgi:hypothetical protein
MPTDLPAQPWPTIAEARQGQRGDGERTQLLTLLCFALSPLAILLLLFFLIGPEKMAQALVCGEPECVAS